MEPEVYKPFVRTKGFHLDIYSRISTLSQINIEIPVAVRYDGMQFYVVSEGKYYHFGPDLSTPLTTDFSSRTILYTLTGGSYDYSNLLTRLAALQINEVYYVSPLDIFVFNASTPFCIDGNYRLTTLNEWTTIPSGLKLPGRDVYITDTNSINIIDNVKNLTSEVITVSQAPTTPLNRRYYKIGLNLYYCIGGVLYKITSNGTVLNRFITDSITLSKHPIYDKSLPLYTSPLIISHGLESKSLDVKLIDSFNNHITVGYKVIDDNNIELISAASITDVNVMITQI